MGKWDWDWAKARSKNEDLTFYKPEKVNTALQLFYVEVRKTDKIGYDHECLRVTRADLERYLKEKSYSKSIIRDEIFAESNGIWKGRPVNWGTMEKDIVLTEQELLQKPKKEFCGAVDNLETRPSKLCLTYYGTL